MVYITIPEICGENNDSFKGMKCSSYLHHLKVLSMDNVGNGLQKNSSITLIAVDEAQTLLHC